MHRCAAFRTGLLGFLLALFSAHTAAAVPSIPQNRTLRVFSYWSECGEKAFCPAGLKNVTLKLTESTLYFFQGQPVSETFSCNTNGSPSMALAELLSSLHIAEWSGQMEQNALFSLSDKKKERLCRWHISAVFEPEAPGAQPFCFSFYGADDGTDSKRAAAEQKLLRFFRAKTEELKAVTPRRLTSLLWWTDNGFYHLAEDDDGVFLLERRIDGESVNMAVHSGLAEELNSIIRNSDLEKFHGLQRNGAKEKNRFRLLITFDTQQQITIFDHGGAGGIPQELEGVFTALQKAMDETLNPPVAKALPASAVKSLSFRVSGMVIGEDIRLYERMNKDGPVMVLARSLGRASEKRREAVLNSFQLAELNALLEKHGVRLWNGFRGRPCVRVLDGEGFMLSAAFRSGEKIFASGENAFPSGYAAFRRAINVFADAILGAQEQP